MITGLDTITTRLLDLGRGWMEQNQTMTHGAKKTLNRAQTFSAALIFRHTRIQQQMLAACWHFGPIFLRITLSIQTLVLYLELQDPGTIMIARTALIG